MNALYKLLKNNFPMGSDFSGILLPRYEKEALKLGHIHPKKHFLNYNFTRLTKEEKLGKCVRLYKCKVLNILSKERDLGGLERRKSKALAVALNLKLKIPLFK
jgi:hypothetical protein